MDKEKQWLQNTEKLWSFTKWSRYTHVARIEFSKIQPAYKDVMTSISTAKELYSAITDARTPPGVYNKFKELSKEQLKEAVTELEQKSEAQLRDLFTLLPQVDPFHDQKKVTEAWFKETFELMRDRLTLSSHMTAHYSLLDALERCGA